MFSCLQLIEAQLLFGSDWRKIATYMDEGSNFTEIKAQIKHVHKQYAISWSVSMV